MKTKCCQTCKFWNPIKQFEGECREKTPEVFYIAGAFASVFPPTHPVTWCGKFKQRTILRQFSVINKKET